MKFSTAVCLMLAGTPFSVGLADDAETQTLHNNVYQQYGLTETCQYQGDCAVLFPNTDHVTTVITGVSCYVTVPSGTSIVYASVGSSGASARFFVQPFYYSTSNGYAVYGINAATNLFVNKGDGPRVDVFSSGAAVTFLQCTVSGNHS